MEQRTLTTVTDKMTTAQSRIRSELGNFPSGPTKFTVIHRRPVFSNPTFSQSTTQNANNTSKAILVNPMCCFIHHPVATTTASQNNKSALSTSSRSSGVSSLTAKSTTPILVSSQTMKNGSSRAKRPFTMNAEQRRINKPILKRSLSADNLEIFQPVPAKRPFPVQIWFNNQPRGPRPLVATAFWLDSPLHDSQAFVYTKLLEASQARRYLQLQSKPRKYLHLTGGWIAAVNNPQPPPRKPEFMLPPMTVKLIAPIKPSTTSTTIQKPSPKPPVAIVQNVAQSPPQRKKSQSNQLPPPPPLISLRVSAAVTKIEVEDSQSPQQEHPLELCKRRKQSNDSVSPPDSPRLVINNSAPSSPLNLSNGQRGNIKRKIAIPAPFTLLEGKSQQEPLDLASPSPTTVFKNLSLVESLSPELHSTENFRRRLILVLQVLLGKRRLINLGHPEVPIEDVLARILKKAGIAPVKSSEVRLNWIKFLRLCVKNEDAWKREGWDRKSPDAILDEIYMQDVIPILRKAEPSRRINEYMQEVETEKNGT